jgi:hypothetical protein
MKSGEEETTLAQEDLHPCCAKHHSWAAEGCGLNTCMSGYLFLFGNTESHAAQQQ